MRFLFPIELLFAFPIVVDAGSALARLPRAVSLSLSAVVCLPMLILAWMLLDPRTTLEQMNWMGVNLSTGQYREEAELAKFLVQVAVQRGHNINVYVPEQNTIYAVIQAVVTNEMLRTRRGFYMHSPIDWEHPPAVRLRQILAADYIFARPPKNQDVA